MIQFVYNLDNDRYEFISHEQFNENEHENANTVFALKLFAYKNGADYCQVRDCLKGIMQTVNLSDLSETEANFVLKHTNALSAETVIAYLMQTYEMSADEAQKRYLQLRVQDIKSAASCYSKRIHSDAFVMTLLMQLGQQQAEEFLFNARIPISDLEQSAILGTTYGNTVSGIMDFIESTGDYTVLGLNQFVSADSELTKKELKDILYHGYNS